MVKKQILIPRYPDGSIPHYAYDAPWLGDSHKLSWSEAEPFKATLTLQGFSRGRSAANFDFKNARGATFTVFMVDFVDLVKSPAWREGKITGTFIACKRGQNYGIKLAS